MLSTPLSSSQEKIHDQPGRDTDHDEWQKIWIRGIRPMVAGAATQRMQSDVNENIKSPRYVQRLQSRVDRPIRAERIPRFPQRKTTAKKQITQNCNELYP
jgi:hypothetical protein